MSASYEGSSYTLYRQKRLQSKALRMELLMKIEEQTGYLRLPVALESFEERRNEWNVKCIQKKLVQFSSTNALSQL